MLEVAISPSTTVLIDLVHVQLRLCLRLRVLALLFEMLEGTFLFHWTASSAWIGSGLPPYQFRVSRIPSVH